MMNWNIGKTESWACKSDFYLNLVLQTVIEATCGKGSEKG